MSEIAQGVHGASDRLNYGLQYILQSATLMSTLTKRKRPHTRKKKLPQLSEKEKEEELLRKLERNRMAFDAWLERKKEGEAVSHMLPK